MTESSQYKVMYNNNYVAHKHTKTQQKPKKKQSSAVSKIYKVKVAITLIDEDYSTVYNI